MTALLLAALLVAFLAPPWLTAALLTAAAVYGWRHRQTLTAGRPAAGAGASSAARARALRTPLVRLASAVGIQTEAARLADRCDAGAAGERQVAALLTELTAQGWTVLPDRALPRGEANVDLLVFSPKGVVFNVDAKLWRSRPALTVEGGRLMHGDRDVTRRLRGLTYETRTVANLLGVRVLSIAAVIGPLPSGTELRAAGVRIIPAADLCTVLRRLDRETLPQQRAARLVDTAGRLLPPKTGR
ncbi:NERD domain-containing protein [Streptomyces sp. HUCO-GS316]|uniref:nuclease-related domain-containing protein n=1 Tax=Streptomyces sp. HUCO-GS316 TaxID=2692198 RepID=UPI001368B4AB|nr:nuclease-related domain-containing protein [Streptomyces sp. HUCO-GS316]MXM66774.1 NERD domain-containing protein [Streptomyces sp. HUCO-GS316]